MTDQTTENAWQRFWARGGWWRSILLAAVYLLVYLGISQLIGLFVRPFIDLDDLYGDPASVLLASILPIGLMGLLLLLFARSLGWLPHLFRRRTARAPRWMWIAVLITVVPPVMKLAGTDWSRFAPALVLAILFFGLCVGFAEELLTRGLTVELLEHHGYSERAVYVLSSVVFGLIHLQNLLGGGNPLLVFATVGYAMGFGAMMFLALRVSRWLIVPMLLHALTDPTTLMAAGGLNDAHAVVTGGSHALVTFASLFNFVYIAFGIVAIFLLPGRKRAL
ncbi:CPBP family intramembrane metalloprotease [Curtobacterium sp. TC1]|uniref:CPBP family intramembrane glutamic endopeptidase n=1 Tax=Curtobacterium sp. TC1 TaxID=2862880 RepID=UPI001C9AB243|nr:CPBP family intramembrane glutamic endopeptidase [Curtobacterium sp. TC1]QZQ55080.1 CPBP family intramembrane metalloprotease [Curtobacterium sp. TC1]